MSVIHINPVNVLNQSRIALAIERLVIRIMRAAEALDPSRAVYEAPNSLHWTLYRDVVAATPGFMAIYQPELFDYSEHLDAFFYACECTGIAELWRQQGAMGLRHAHQVQWQHLVNAIVAYTRTAPFKRRIRDREYEIEQYWQGLQQYVNTTGDSFARLLSVRFDCYYYKGHRDRVTVHEFFEHLRRFTAVINRRRGIFCHLASYCRVAEQATDTGFHIHFGFLFKGHHHQKPYYLVGQMSDLWQQITQCRGYCYSNNQNEKVFEERGINGIGMVRRNDEGKRGRMLKVMHYMGQLKPDPQHLRIRPKGARAFSKGQ